VQKSTEFKEYQNRFQTIILVQKVVGGGFLYYNKVEISGVNTAKLTVLKESEKTELLKRVKQGDMTARGAYPRKSAACSERYPAFHEPRRKRGRPFSSRLYRAD